MPTLICINYDKQFKIIWAIFIAVFHHCLLPKVQLSWRKKSPHFILTTCTHKCFSWCQHSVFFIRSMHMARSRLETHYLLQTQCRQLTKKRRECHLQIYVPLPTELHPDCTSSPAALAGRGQLKIQADTAMPTNPRSPMLASNYFRVLSKPREKKGRNWGLLPNTQWKHHKRWWRELRSII